MSNEITLGEEQPEWYDADFNVDYGTSVLSHDHEFPEEWEITSSHTRTVVCCAKTGYGQARINTDDVPEWTLAALREGGLGIQHTDDSSYYEVYD